MRCFSTTNPLYTPSDEAKVGDPKLPPMNPKIVLKNTIKSAAVIRAGVAGVA